MPPRSEAQRRLMEALSGEQRAYLAGLFDGEGTVAVYESSSASRGERRPIWVYQVQITNCSLKVLDHVAAAVGGSVVRKSAGRVNWRQCFVWRLCGDGAATFMEAVLPFAIVKADEIREALRFRELCQPRRHRQTEAELAEKRSIVVRLKELKRAS